ncbi:MAG: hypothetical protein JWN95_388 [Frankiales bacterium]|nr:hypothetical protein [Frankiales bacterium]
MIVKTVFGGRFAAEADSARRLYDAEVALHIARQTGVDPWIQAASNRLHEALVSHFGETAVAS